MTDFMLPNNQSLRIAFVGNDIAIRATSQDERGDNVATGTFLYGSGKAGMMGNSTPQEDGLMRIFAALAQGRQVVLQSKNLEIARAAHIDTPRPGDKIIIGSNEDGDLTFIIEGQDLECSSIIALEIQNLAGGDAPTRSLYNGLHNYLAEYGTPKVF
ncbi:MAG: hypothetical protein PHX61_00175 [Alphaproteobacteria bacterium]|nr:hypothetical protein [Alphaproteobacteria bacterium]